MAKDSPVRRYVQGPENRVTAAGRYRNAQGLVWLNVASGPDPLPDFANLDNHIWLHAARLPRLITGRFKRYAAAIEKYRAAGTNAKLIRHDCRKPIDLPANSADHILCSHFIEHVYPDEADAILKDFFRVLKPGGTAHIIVPDLALQVSAYHATNDADVFVRETLLSISHRGSLRYRIMEALGGFGLQHRWMYDQASISRKMSKAGFELLPVDETPSRTYREGDGESVHIVGRKALS